VRARIEKLGAVSDAAGVGVEIYRSRAQHTVCESRADDLPRHRRRLGDEARGAQRHLASGGSSQVWPVGGWPCRSRATTRPSDAGLSSAVTIRLSAGSLSQRTVKRVISTFGRLDWREQLMIVAKHPTGGRPSACSWVCPT
jgi:hypothetical protein